MRMQLTAIVCAIFFSSALSAQEIISPAGEETSNGTHKLQYTIGEVFTQTEMSENFATTTGFTQPNVQVLLPTEMGVWQELNVQVFPNPTVNWVNIEFSPRDEPLQFQILNEAGQLINEKSVEPGVTTTRFNLQELPVGGYILIVKLGNAPVSKAKILKLN